MLTYTEWLLKFPQFTIVEETVFDMYVLEASLEMGTEVSRWIDQSHYDVALGYLVSHLLAIADKFEDGDHTPVQPLREKEVDDVRVEYAISREMQNSFDQYQSTSYGQQYIKWRRMVFAGPRIA